LRETIFFIFKKIPEFFPDFLITLKKNFKIFFFFLLH